MKHKKILFVCTGNTCRSPMAEAAFRAELKKRRIRWYTVHSAGLHAEEGTMNPNSAQALTEAKIPFAEDFKPRQLTEKMLDEAHIVICMTDAQALSIGRANVSSMYALGGKEIPDPYGQSIDVYRATLRVIRECLPRIIMNLHLGEETND